MMKNIVTKKFLLLSLLVMAVYLLWPELAEAATGAGGTAAPNRAKNTFGMYSNVANNVGRVPKAVSIIAYASGTFFTASGLLKLKDWISDNERNPINPALFRLGAGAFMIFLPWALVIATASVYGYDGSGSLRTTNVNSAPGFLSPFCKSTGGAC